MAGAITALDFNRDGNPVGIYQGPLMTKYAEVTTGELRALMDAEKPATVLDVREPADYVEEHIPGAKSLPTPEIEAVSRELFDKHETLVVYSRNPWCAASAVAADKLITLGFTRVRRYVGGIKAWKDEGCRTERARALEPPSRGPEEGGRRGLPEAA